jgi:hypothetical protein
LELTKTKSDVERKTNFINRYIQISYEKIDNLLHSKYIENDLYKLGYVNLKQKLIVFLKELHIERNQIEKLMFYKGAYISNEIIRTNDNYHGSCYFSDIEIFISEDQIEQFSSEDGMWYGKVCIKIFICK